MAEQGHSARTEVTLAPWSKDGDEWVAWLNGDLLAPTFQSKGAATIYLEAVVIGTRKPEYPVRACDATYPVRQEIKHVTHP